MSRFFVLFLLLPTLAWGSVSTPVVTPHVEARLLAEPLDASGKARLAWHFKLAPGWHIYWKNPGDSGLPPQLDLESLNATPKEWGVPEIIRQDPYTSYGYKEEAYFLWDIQPKTSENTFIIKGKWLICEEICIPEEGEFTLTLTDKPEPDLTRLLDKLEANLPRSSAQNGSFSAGERVTLQLPSTHTLKPFAPGYYFLPLTPGISGNDGGQSLKKQEDRLIISSSVSDYFDKNTEDISVLVQTTDNKNIIYRVKKSLELIDLKQNYQAENLGGILLLALLGGLILNLMPCVFPVLSIKVLSYIKKSGKDRQLIRREGYSYAAGVILSFLLIALVLTLLKSTGQSLGWGFQLQSPSFILALIFVFFFFGLSLSGFIEVGTSLMGIGSGVSSRPGLRGAFLTGVLATVVATPCMAPFMATAVGYALSQSVTVIFAVFTALGLGLALPYLILTSYPKLLTYLPKPGRWMETFKEAMAFPLYLTVAGLVWVLSQQLGAAGVLSACFGLVVISFAVWLARQKPARGRLIAVISLALLAWLAFSPKGHAEPALKEVPFSLTDLEDLQAADIPVFVNMTAAWCLTCKINEQITFERNEITQAFRDANVTYMVGDWTNYNQEITEYLESFGRSGVPLYVFYPARGDGPVVLPQILTPGLVLETLSPTSK